jgi:Flp pilus assembly protein TadD
MRAALALSALLVGCAARRGPGDGPVIEEPAAWETERGREAAQMQLANTLADGSSPEQALVLIADLRAQGVEGRELDVVQARALRKVGLLEDAEGILVPVTRRHRRHAPAWMELGTLRMEQKQVEEAVQAFERAVALTPSDAEAHNNLGFALMAAGRAPEAVTALRRAIELDASQARTRNNLGFALVAAGREDEAYRVFRATASEADARYNLGLGLELRGDSDAAGRAYQSALASNPHHASAQARLSQLASDTPVSSPNPSATPDPSERP